MESSYRIARDVRYRIIDDEAVVVRQTEGDVLVLNDVAARVLQLVGDGLSPAEIGDRVAGEYDAPEADIRKDVKRFFGELETLQVIESIPATGDTP